MVSKVVVLYPAPIDPAKFESKYHAEHMPLMHSLITPASRVPTFRVRGPAAAPYYRMAEIHFPSLAELYAFGSSEGARVARQSAQRVAGFEPITLVCEADE